MGKNKERSFPSKRCIARPFLKPRDKTDMVNMKNQGNLPGMKNEVD